MCDNIKPKGQVCPNPECHIDQRWKGFRGFVCPECACRLVIACRYCNEGATDYDLNLLAVCKDHKGLVLNKLPSAAADIVYNVT